MHNVKFYLRTVFGFSAREVNGFLVMAFIMLVFLAIPPIVDIFFAPAIPADSPSKIFADTGASSIPNTGERSVGAELFSFNPNTATSKELQQLGLKNYLAARIEKFRNKGGTFRQSEDLLKIYGMDSTWYERVKDSIVISTSKNTASNTKSFPAFKKNTPYKKAIWSAGASVRLSLLDINTCDSAQLESLRGIGPTLASRIIRYRQKLGGFIDTTQFKEVYGLKDFSLEELKRSVTIASRFTPTKIPINTASAAELGPHPYIGWKAANTIVRWRAQHGTIVGIEQLNEMKAMENPERLLPYVQF